VEVHEMDHAVRVDRCARLQAFVRSSDHIDARRRALRDEARCERQREREGEQHAQSVVARRQATPSARTTQYAAAAIAAHTGSVNTHALTMRPPTPHRTADKRRVAPAPMIAPVIVCVVDTGMPKNVAPYSVSAPPISAAKPRIGCSLQIFWPIV